MTVPNPLPDNKNQTDNLQENRNYDDYLEWTEEEEEAFLKILEDSNINPDEESDK